MIQGEKTAWLTSGSETLAVSVAGTSGRSAIRDLIEAIFFRESLATGPSRARTLLRERIHSNAPAGIADRETVKVAAKRLSAPTDFSLPKNAVLLEAPPPPTFPFPDLSIGDVIDPRNIPTILERLKGETTRARDRWSSDRPVSAILVDASDRLLGWAWNTNAAIRTRHAEWNLCEGLGSRKIPAGARLFVSLKPCRMCAARIWEAAEDPARIEVNYLENDPGPLAQGTMLEPRSAARVRYLGVDHPLFDLGSTLTNFGAP